MNRRAGAIGIVGWVLGCASAPVTETPADAGSTAFPDAADVSEVAVVSDVPDSGAARHGDGVSLDSESAALSDAAATRPDAVTVGDDGSDGNNVEGGTAPCIPMLDGVAVDERELTGYPSYAVLGCQLVYVAGAADRAPGELRLRDFASLEERVIAPATEMPRRPSIAQGLVSYEANLEGRSVVRVWLGSETRTLSGAFDHAGEPRAAGSAVVFTAWLSADALGDTDIMLYDSETGVIRTIFGGPGQQRFADIADAHIAASDFAEDPDGRFDDNHDDLADIVVYERASESVARHLLPGKQAFPMLSGSGGLAYLHWDWAAVHPEPKLSGYQLRSSSLVGANLTNDRDLAQVTSATPPYVRPAARAGIVEWVDAPMGQANHRLWRASLADALAPQIVLSQPAALYAPAMSAWFTVLAGRTGAGGALRLTAVLR